MTSLRGYRWLILGTLIGTMLVPRLGTAQQGDLPPDLAAQANDGVAVEILSSATVSPSADAPALSLRRLIPQSGADPIAVVVGPEIWYVEAGTLTLGLEGAKGTTYQAGETAVLDTGGTYTYHVEGKTCPAVLRLELTTVFAMEVSSGASGPTLAGETPRCPTDGILVRNSGSLNIPASPAFAFIARMTWPAGNISNEHAFSGPVGYAPESGALTVSLFPGGNALLAPGSWIVVDGQQNHSVTGAEGSAATALVAGLVSSSETVPPTPTVVSGVHGKTYLSPTYGYTAKWDDTWSVSAESSVSGEDLLQLNNGASDVYIRSFGNYAEDAKACVASIAAQLPTQSGFSEVKPLTTAAGDPVAGGDESRSFAAYAFVYTSNNIATDYVEYVECRTIVPGQSVLVITQFVTREAYSGQVEKMSALLDGLVVPKP